ncbi:MAG: 50S ribosomal protein L25/general stress protein Ctc [Thiobacillaceae bacterium]|nr:50S ribosomal protein L25/general stress protein Ctc [Thiobacillaceae bacterium]MCX7672967.1 50S ribosomal protein L25/general stress protein Ctc [Thiobacillaceae bacterium]MDW8324530.1 50S ribosomal protein L25/general stress protein Ctc [Burkholderiales bacterium]
MHFEINASKRDQQGTGASRRLRRAGRVPGIVYGGDKPALPISMDHKELYLVLRQEASHSSVLDLKIDGEAQPVLLKDVQLHPYKQQILHVDFQRVDATHKVHVKVPLHFINGDIAPGVKLQGGVLSHVMTEVEVVCYPKDLPEYIEVDLKDLSAGHSLHLSHLKLPPGVELPQLARGEDPTVATILGAKAEAEGGEEGAA